jgi:hypothetical protein
VRGQMHGTSVMDIQSATRFKVHMEEAVKELSSALLLAHQVYAHEESATIRKSIGDIIAAVDAVLHDSVYSHHPALNELHRRQK